MPCTERQASGLLEAAVESKGVAAVLFRRSGSAVILRLCQNTETVLFAMGNSISNLRAGRCLPPRPRVFMAR